MQKKTRLIVFLGLILVLKSFSVFGQGDCECTNCPQFMQDFFVGDISLTVQNATFDDLSDPDQGICGVSFELDHQYIGDLQIELIAPNGDKITLVGDIGLTGETDLTKWDISFVRDADTAFPDAGFSAKWSNAQAWGLGNTYTGSYYPFAGKLEDFNTGTVNGTWTIRVADRQANDVGTLIDFSIDFCKPDGIQCSTNPCGLFVDLQYESLFCSGENVIIDGSNSASGLGITYTWSTQDGHFIDGTDLHGPIVEVDASGTYTLTIKENGLCDEVKSAIITLLGAAPDLAIAAPDVITCSNTEVVLDANGSSTNDAIIQWYDGVIINDVNANNLLGSKLTQTVTSPGIYTLQVVNTQSGCYQDTTIEVLGVFDYPELSVPTPDTLNCLNTTITVSPNSPTAANSDTISWSGPNGFTAGTLDINAVDSGTYFITLTNQLGCKTLDTVEIVKDTDTPANISTNAATIHCNTPTVQISASSSTNGVSYAWTGPNNYSSSDQNPSDVSEPGDYNLIVTAPNGCTSTDSITVATDAILPDLSLGFVNINTIDCNNTSLDIQAQVTDNVTFDWSSSNNNFSGTDAIVSVTESGTYRVTITDSTGCKNVESIDVLDDLATPQDLVISATEITCKDNATIQISSSTPNTSAHWEGPMGLVSENKSIVSADAGDYLVTVTGANGCTSTETITVTEDKSKPNASANGGKITCAAGSVNLTGSSTTANVTYAWTGPNGFVSNEQNPLVGAAGTYTLITTGENGCESDPVDATVENDNGVPNISATTNGGILTLDCNNTSIDLMGTSSSSNVNYEWTGPNLSTTQTTATVNEPGTYTFKVSADNGCKSETDIVIDQDLEKPQNIDFDKQDIDCNNMMVDIKVNSSTDNLSYNWGGNGFSSNSNLLQVNQGGDYMVTITGANGCSEIATVNIAEDRAKPVVDVGLDKNIDCITETVEIGTLNSSTGSDFVYQWLDSGNVPKGNDLTLNVDKGDTYTLIITNNKNGCIEQASVLVDENKVKPSQVEINPEGLVLDCEMTEISTQTSFTNVTTPSYSWSGPNGDLGTDKDIAITDPGKYVFIISNLDNGCSSMASIKVVSDTISPDVSAADGTIPCDPGSFDLKATSSTSGTTFLWESPSSLQEIGDTWTVTEAGTYTLIATGENACTSEIFVEVTPDKGVPELKLADVASLTCDRLEVVLDASASTLVGDGNIDYHWTDMDNNDLGPDSSITVLSPGEYTLTEINSSNKCEVSKTITVEQDTISPTSIAGMDQIFTCEDLSKTLSGAASKPASPTSSLKYKWSKNGETVGRTSEVVVSFDGTYTLLVTDTENGCTDESSVNIIPDKNKPLLNVDISGLLTCDILNVDLDANQSTVAPTSTGNLSFEWIKVDETSDLNPIISVSEPGDYKLTITDDANGCAKDTTITVQQNIKKPKIRAKALNKITCASDVAELSADGSKDNNVSYKWSGLDSESVDDSDQLVAKVTQPGKYQLILTDKDNGCTSTRTVTVKEDRKQPKVDPTVDGQIDCITPEVTISIGDSEKGNNIDYTWEGPSLMSSDQNVLVSSDGVYTLTVLNKENGCTDTSSITVTKLPKIDGFNDELFNQSCHAFNSGRIEFGESLGGTSPFMYSIDGGVTFSSNNSFNNLAPGIYNIVVQGARGCEFKKEVEIESYIQPELDLGEDVTLTLGESIELHPVFLNINGDSIVWSLDSLTGFNPTLSPTETTFIDAIVYDEQGCTAKDRLAIFVEKIRPVYIPSAFSPNGDGINDFFTVYTGKNLAVKKINSMLIFDRWGNLLFENYNFDSDNPSEGWSGIFKNQQMEEGVYTYFVDIEFLDGSSEIYKGDISLLR